ncbi:hypothetical protein F5Y05DRAFT_291752 [Hypoxylon sp. FL0543]|nr:hypothetical protein F5Y05DRAFT_291752 [Hypoxylon sp. FL0543]
MVSFFGFKIGGEKKKKTEVEISPTQLRRKLDQSPVVDDEFPIRGVANNVPAGGNVYSVTQPDASNSYKITATRARASPYGSESAGPAAMSMSELSQLNPPNLKQYASNPNLGTNRYNSSTTDLVPPVPVRNPSRPASPVKQQSPPQNWMNPLEMHSTKGPSQFTVTMINAPKSPLGQFELNVETPSEAATPFPNEDEVPMPLRIRRPSPAPQPVEPPTRSQSPIKPPSPPQSIRGVENQSPVLGRPSFSRDDVFRPSSRGSHRNMPTALKEVRNMRDMPNYGPASIPSPISTPRGSEEKPTNNLMNLLGEPIIRQVGARRDTLTSTAPRRLSLEMKVVELSRPRIDDSVQRPKTSNGSGPQTRPLVRPPPLNLDHRPRTPDRAGTYPPAPFMMGQRPQTPTGGGCHGRVRDRSGPPPAAFGAHGRPGRPNTRNVRRPAVDEYEIQPQSQPSSQPSSQPQSRRASLDSSNYDRPPSPDSPLLPQTGPLASPRFPPIDSQLAPPPLQGGVRSHLQKVETFLLEDDPEEQLEPPRLGHRNVPTPDPSDWPLPSPTGSAFETSQSYRPESPFVYGGIRAESPFSRAESPLPTPPRVLPQGVAARSDSPFGFRSFNFSRPMTPTLEQPPLRRDIVTPGAGSLQPPHIIPKRSETAPLSPRFRDAESSPSPGPPPPPRANTVTATNQGRGLRSPAIVGDDFGGGFI